MDLVMVGKSRLEPHGMAMQPPEDSSCMKPRERTRCLISMELKVRITPRSLAEMQSRSFRRAAVEVQASRDISQPGIYYALCRRG
jgi:hypothetical protein